MRHGFVAAPPFIPPGGMRLPGLPPAMPPLPVHMPMPPTVPQSQLAQAASPQMGGQAGTPGLGGVPAQSAQGLPPVMPQASPGSASPGAMAMPVHLFPGLPLSIPPAALGQGSPGPALQGLAGGLFGAGNGSAQQAPPGADPFWAQQLQAQQAALQQAAMAAVLPGLARQVLGGSEPPRPEPDPRVSATQRRVRAGTYTTRGLQGGYSTRG